MSKEGNQWLYWMCRNLIRVHMRLWHQLSILGADNVPKDGGAIIASNHISHLDPPAVGCSTPRQARFVGKEELFHTFFLSWFLPTVGVIPIKRGGGGRAMLDTAAEAIKGGSAVILFPEGTRSITGFPLRPRTGVVVLAAMTGAPVVPARISGSHDCMPPGKNLLRPGRIQVAFGEPLRWEPGQLDSGNREQMVSEAARIMDAILALPGWYPRKAGGVPPEHLESANGEEAVMPKEERVDAG